MNTNGREAKENDMQISDIARICHEANRAYCVAIGDLTQQPWEAAPEWQRESAINGVKFHLENATAGASGSHENWMREKVAQGWKYGTVKDPEKKEHPSIVPYADLPVEQRRKDSLFTAIVFTLKGALS